MGAWRLEATLARIDRWSTAGVPVSQRLALWSGIVTNNAGGMVIETEPESFHGALTRLVAGELEITSVKSSAVTTRSTGRAGSDARTFSLQLVHSGQCRLRHAGVENILDTGDMIIVDARRPYELSFKRPLHGLVLSLPWPRFERDAAVLDAFVGRPMNPRSGPTALLSGFIRSAWDELVERDGEVWPQSASDVIWDLLMSALHDDRAAKPAATRADALRRKASTLVERRLFDPEFTSSGMAEALGVSARYLQQVFAEVGTTPSRFLLGRRLNAAAARLRQAGRPCRITDVALECGFSDLSYFSRSFRCRFGVSAVRYRSTHGVVMNG